MNPGDIVFWRDEKFGHHRFWEIRGVFLGGTGQESVVELLSLTERPAHSGVSTVHETTFVPEPLLRNVPIYTPLARDDISLSDGERLMDIGRSYDKLAQRTKKS